MADALRCPSCGADLPADAPAGLCPKCLLQAGFASEADAAERLAATESHQGTPAPSFTPPTPADLASRFPQLEILELLGQGGMGAVYKARQPGLDRLVAVKILPPEAGRDPAFAERFTREGRAMARLSHPHITNVYDFGQADGQFYLVMEYVEGVNLRQAIRSQSVSPPAALTIVTQVCDALQYAHDEGVVHRDIKPENILLDKRGRVKIADFGLAKLLGVGDAATELTGAQQVMGTLRYMAPEQMEGSRNVDHRADIYSLGVVFYELLTGEVPMGRFQPPSAKVQVDVRIDDVVLKSLEREPERRYQHASEVKSDVDAVTGSDRSTESTAQAREESDLDRLMRQMLRDNKGLDAIRAYRAATGAGLSEARAAIKRIAAAEGLPLVKLSTSQRLKEIAFASLAIAIGVNIGAPGDHLIIKICALLAYVAFLIGHAVGARRERTLLSQAAPGHADGQDASQGTPRSDALRVRIVQVLLACVAFASAAAFFWPHAGFASFKGAGESAAIGTSTIGDPWPWLVTTVKLEQGPTEPTRTVERQPLAAPWGLTLIALGAYYGIVRLERRLPAERRFRLPPTPAIVGLWLLAAVGMSLGEETRASRQIAKNSSYLAPLPMQGFHEWLSPLSWSSMAAGRGEELKQKAKTYLSVMETAPDADKFTRSIFEAHALLGTIALYEGDLQTAKSELRAASQAPGSQSVFVSQYFSILPAALLRLGERQAVVEFLTACKRIEQVSGAQTADFVGMRIEAIERGEAGFAYPRPAAGSTDLISVWASEATLPGDDQAHEAIQFGEDGRVLIGALTMRTTTFKRDGVKVAFGDGAEAELRDGRLVMTSSDQDEGWDDIRPQTHVENSLSGVWRSTLRDADEVAAVREWTFNDEDEGDCTVATRTVNPQRNLRATPLFDRLIWVLDDGAVVPIRGGDAARREFSRLAHWCRYNVADFVLTLEGDTFLTIRDVGPQKFQQHIELPWLAMDEPSQ